MVAPRDSKNIHYTIVRVPTLAERTHDRLSRPSDLLPWADPYIARLVQKLQAEVRSERITGGGDLNAVSALKADLDPPSPFIDTDEEWADQPRFTFQEESPT